MKPPREPARRSLRGVVEKHDDKLTQILTTAATLFAENGFETTTLDAIADRLDMHKATLYHYVRGKGEILYLCQSRSFGDLEEVEAQVRDRSRPLLERLHLFALHLARAQNSVFGRCLVMVGPRPLAEAAGGEIRQWQRRLDTIVRDLLKEGMASGELRSADPGLCVAMLFGALNWVPRWYRPEGRYDVDQIAQAFVDILVHGLRTGPGNAAAPPSPMPAATDPPAALKAPRPRLARSAALPRRR